MTTQTPAASPLKKIGTNISEHHVAVVDAFAAREGCTQAEAFRRIIDHAEKTLQINVKKV